MKRLGMILMASLLLLGFTQCKKEQPTNQNETEGVRIALTVDGGNGSKVNVNPNASEGYATVAFETGDIIYVGNNGAYCGYLTHNGTNFSGTVTPTSEADYLHFYFMGNKGPADSEPTSVSITDQTGKYPVISYAHSTVLYNSGVNTYSAKLQNYCSIVKFTTNSIPTATAVTVKGMKNTVSVNFGANNAAASTSGSPYTFTTSGDGDITLHAESTTERWAILLEQNEASGATVTALGYYNGTCNVPAISNNTYHPTGVSVSLTDKSVNLAGVDADTTICDGYRVYGTLSELVKISIADGATVTLDGVNINGVNSPSYQWAGITCLGDATIILSVTNTVKGFNHYPGIYVPQNKTVTIQGSGSLTASSNGMGCGIGGGFQNACGNIVIAGGTITATGGGNGAAGIGGGYRSSCGNISITGGNITANGGVGAAGIGGGMEASCGNITITNGVTSLTVTKGNSAPYSIGPGSKGSCGTVTIGGAVGEVRTSPYTYPEEN